MYEASKGNGRYEISLRLWDTGNGWTGSLTGGESPHVGSVVLANPRSSLTGQGLSCDIWSIPLPGHLDYEVAVPLVKRFCSLFALPLALTVGIHIDDASEDEIENIRLNCEEIWNEFLNWKSRTEND
jgi:hypothetical protein